MSLTNYYEELQKRAAQGKSIRLGMIGFGRFPSTFTVQLDRIPGMQLVGVAELNPARAQKTCDLMEWPKERYSAKTFEEAARNGTTCIVTDADELFKSDFIDILVDATGNPYAGIHNVKMACQYHKDIIMVNIECMAAVGPILNRMADEAGIILSYAYGDQPAKLCSLIDWARTCGFEVCSAGEWRPYTEGDKELPPTDIVFERFGYDVEEAHRFGMNPKGYCSFLDNTKGAIEMCVVANATGLGAPEGGLHYYPAGYADLPNILKPKADGGKLSHFGVMEVCAPNYPDRGVSAPVPGAFRAGMYVVMHTDGRPMTKDAVIKAWYPTDDTHQYSAYMLPVHGIGLELGVTAAAIAVSRKATGRSKFFATDVVSISKKDLTPGEILDGDGGFCAHGEFFSADESLRQCALPMGLSEKMKIIRPVKKGQLITWNDVQFDETNEGVKIRREMEEIFRKEKRL